MRVLPFSVSGTAFPMGGSRHQPCLSGEVLTERMTGRTCWPDGIPERRAREQSAHPDFCGSNEVGRVPANKPGDSLFFIEEYMFIEKKKKPVTWTSSKMEKAGDGTRTRDSLLGRHVPAKSPLASCKMAPRADLTYPPSV